MPKAAVLDEPLAGLKRRVTELWRVYPREVIGFGALALAAGFAVAGAAQSTPELPGSRLTTPQVAPPAPPPMLVRQIAPEQALQVNATIPVDTGPNPAAAQFA